MASSSLPMWLRRAPIGAIFGLLSTSVILLMSTLNGYEVMSFTRDIDILETLLGGCFLTALIEFISAYDELDSQLKETRDLQGRNLPKPFHVTAATFISCLLGIIAPVPIASLVAPLIPRILVLLFEVTIGLAACGWLLARLGKTSAVKSILRVVIGGWIFLGVSIGLPFLNAK